MKKICMHTLRKKMRKKNSLFKLLLLKKKNEKVEIRFGRIIHFFRVG